MALTLKHKGYVCTYEMVADIPVLIEKRFINKIGLMPGNIVHLHSKNGSFPIIEVGRYYFVVQTKKMRHDNKVLYCLNEDFKCHYKRN